MKNSEYLGFIDENTIMNYYLMLILIYIKFKYGNYNPEILFIFLDYYQQYNNFFLLFIKCLQENNKNNKTIVNHFFIGDFISNKKNINYLNEKYKRSINKVNKIKNIYFLFDNIKFFFNNYLSDLNEIKNSLVYDYIISVLAECGKYNREKEYLIPSIMLNISQNEKIINILLGKIISNEISLYDFLKVECDPKNENKFRKFIYVFIQNSKKFNLKSKYIFPLKTNSFQAFRYNLYFYNNLFIKNANQFFSSLKKKSINLYDCIQKNLCFIQQTFDMLFILLYKYNSLKGKKNDEIDDKSLTLIGDEIYEFCIKFMNSNNKSKKKYNKFYI